MIDDEPPPGFGKLGPEWEGSIVAEDERRARELDALRAEIARLTREKEAAERERDAWRNAMQSWTPGGSEFTTPEVCSAFVAMRREIEHAAKCRAVRAERELAALRQSESGDPRT